MENLVILKGKASAKQGTNIIKAPIIHYDTQKHVLNSKSNQHGRTHIMVNLENLDVTTLN